MLAAALLLAGRGTKERFGSDLLILWGDGGGDVR